MKSEELSDAARLLGPARMVLDRCAENVPGCRQEASDMAQRIVDLIGHPVTDEPPHAIVERDRLRDLIERISECYEGTFDKGGHIFVPADVWAEVKQVSKPWTQEVR